MNSPFIFDRSLVRQRRSRAIATLTHHNFLFDWAMNNLIDRLDLIKRRFPRILQLGTRCSPPLSIALMQAAGGELLIRGDQTVSASTDIVFDEERLPFAPASFDLIISPLSLHTVNDLPGSLIQLRRGLKPDGLFLAAIPGGATLHELRTSLMHAEIETKGGVSPRVAPFADRQQLASLMQRAGFTLPVIDVDTLTVSYENTAKLFADLRGMGEANAVAARARHFPGKALWQKTEDLYHAHYAEPNGRLPATFEIIFMAGWAPHESQQKPARRGSAVVNLAEALETQEIAGGAPVTP